MNQTLELRCAGRGNTRKRYEKKVLDEPILVGLYVLKYDKQKMHEIRSILAIYNDLSRH